MNYNNPLHVIRRAYRLQFQTANLLTYTRLTASFLGQPGKPVSETSLDLNKTRDGGLSGWQWHQLDHTETICTSLQTDNHTNTSSLNVCRSDALPDAEPTVSKH